MKKYLILIFLFSLIACKENPIPKPENDLGVETMIDIYYDIALLQASENYSPSTLTKNNVMVNNYIYKKYKIDSTTFVQNQHYYASDVKEYEKMYKKVVERIERQQAELEEFSTKKKTDSITK